VGVAVAAIATATNAPAFSAPQIDTGLNRENGAIGFTDVAAGGGCTPNLERTLGHFSHDPARTADWFACRNPFGDQLTL
jgi:hypothetical protein